MKRSYGYTAKDKDCLARAMFFESNRSSREGLVAVGTVVMNRLQSGEYGGTVCQVVGQKGQFASGVLSRKMDSKALPDVVAAADSVLKGERHPAVKNAMFFHTAGLRFPYKNMHYVLQAGGNAFYEKRGRHRMMERQTLVAEAAPQADTARQSAAAELPGKEPRLARIAAVVPQSRGEVAAQNMPTTNAAASLSGKGPRLIRVAAAVPQSRDAVVAQNMPANGALPVSKASFVPGQKAGVQQASATKASTVSQTALSYEADPKAVDAIGLLIATQNRPMPRVK
ncbi:cell wall hydrolase [Pseudaminobacter soli (ex Li et al. 2025)]|uniref:cell wall hydrolase n=1 Tax=Pseudaminobacter soli (ex Li et al. 2025) TaxID=1295366 RepID=UPI0024757F12|nr:cell wall hydrolase [Mesorhizobium soli]